MDFINQGAFRSPISSSTRALQRIVSPQFNRLFEIAPEAADNPQASSLDAVTLGEMLGRIKRKKNRKKLHAKIKNLPKAKKVALAKALVKAKAASPAKPASKAAKTAKAVAVTKAKVKMALLKNPALKARLKKLAVLKKVKDAQNAPTPATEYQDLPVPKSDPVIPAPPPSDGAVYEPRSRTPGEAVEETEDEGALDNEQQEAQASSEAYDEVEDEAEDEAEEEEEASLTEPTDEEAEEEAEEASEMAGASILGRMKAKAKKAGKQKLIAAAARPLAARVQKRSKGAIKADTVLKGCALITAAKAGNAKAKAAITALTLKAAAGNAAAKKTLAQLKLCGATLAKAKKTVKAKIKGTKALSAPTKKRAKGGVKLVSSGLRSYSAHQRGLAMIPKFARAQFSFAAGR
jgi:hypothetical protein